MNNTINSWTSGLANFLNMGRNQRENVTGEVNIPNQGNDTHYWADQSGGNRFILHQNLHGISPKDIYQKGNNFVNPMDYSQFSPSIPNFKTAAYTSLSGMKQIVSITDIGSVVAHYYDLGKYVGLGGAIRFFMLCKQIKHSFINISLNDENINIGVYSSSIDQDSGFSYPLIIHNKKFHLFGTVPTLRYIAKKIGEYGIDAYRDYALDIFSETLSEWRNLLLLAILEKISESKIFQDTKEEVTESDLNSSRMTNFSRNISKVIEDTKKTFGTAITDDNYYNNYLKSRRKFFKSVESILVNFSANPFIPLKGEMIALDTTTTEGKEIPRQLCNCPSYCELFLFSIIYDDSVLIKENSKFLNENDISTEKLLEEFPKLHDLFQAIMAYPLITQWYKEMEQPSETEESSQHTSNKATNTINNEKVQTELNGVRTATPKKVSDIDPSIFDPSGTNIPIHNEPRTTNTITYRLAPPKSQVIFPNNSNNNQRVEIPNIYHQTCSKNPNVSTNTFNAIRINNYETSFRPSNPQPNVNVRIANFSKVNNLPYQMGQGHQVSTARQFNNYSDMRQNTQYPPFAPSTFR
ncbi:putative low complexity protein [Cryptosporidium ubiquitum]|uniref:Putative low complexity protein n=1 Tax=Cryptosporidium ubiquitum TaxID=857276 RepID=A0A1J4MGJ7_9CRYT|nr:putative low complexity protein [Cryptosporidium ubiquitum]OII73358.1 putative low complexity protein [Cryptosporidium ubiquitum]